MSFKTTIQIKTNRKNNTCLRNLTKFTNSFLLKNEKAVPRKTQTARKSFFFHRSIADSIHLFPEEMQKLQENFLLEITLNSAAAFAAARTVSDHHTLSAYLEVRISSDIARKSFSSKVRAYSVIV